MEPGRPEFPVQAFFNDWYDVSQPAVAEFPESAGSDVGMRLGLSRQRAGLLIRTVEEESPRFHDFP